MTDLLLELFSEEIPARMQQEAATNLAAALHKALQAAGIEHDADATQIFATPRRIAVIIQAIPAVGKDITLEKKGPKTSAPQAAIDGFLRKEGLEKDALEKRTIEGQEVYFAVFHRKGQETKTVLKPLIEKILADFTWPKSMRWGSNTVRWVRPLHSIVCLFGQSVIPVSFAGKTAGNITFGHRFLAPEAITLSQPEEYEAKLAEKKVIASFEKRKNQIQEQATQVAAKHGLSVREDAGLLEEVTGLVEYPTLIMGDIDTQFMDLPPEVLVSVMRTHQKYFALLDSNQKIASHFIFVSNMQTPDAGAAIKAGNERVLRARFADGRFFYDQDRSKSLEVWAEQLSKVTFHARIGTIAEKVERIQDIAKALSDYIEVDTVLVKRAVALCKADLVTGMVGEFPELQGKMGRYYAIHAEENRQVADAIAEHYLPLGASAGVPTQSVCVVLAIADRLDTLISLFAIGEKPTGSKDPFALRRAALGIIRIILENNITLPLCEFVNEELVGFFMDRLVVQLRERAIRPDIIKAIIAKGGDDLLQITQKAEALQQFITTEAGINLLAAYKRANNIVTAAEKKEDFVPRTTSYTDITVQEARLAGSLNHFIQTLRVSDDFTHKLEASTGLREAVDDFFNEVMINVEETEIRHYRLSLLADLRSHLNRLADFSLIEG